MNLTADSSVSAPRRSKMPSLLVDMITMRRWHANSRSIVPLLIGPPSALAQSAAADVAVTGTTVSFSSPTIGSSMTCTTTVNNDGPNQARCVVVTHSAIPEGARAFPILRMAGVPDHDGRVRSWWLWDGQKRYQPNVGLMRSPLLFIEEHVTYPTFRLPVQLAEKPSREWSPIEAEQYRDWLLSVLDQRVKGLCLYFQEACQGDPEPLLLRLGKKVTAKLNDSQFSTTDHSGRRRLTNAGYALAADMGLLVAKVLLETGNSALSWTIVRKPRSDASYNLPVLSGFGSATDTLDPIGVSVAYATSILRGQGPPKAWAELYSSSKPSVAGDNPGKAQ